MDLQLLLGYASAIRFRGKFGALGWMWVCVALAYLSEWVFRGRLESSTAGLAAVVFSLNVLLHISNHLFVWWDIDSAGLREHRFWNTRDVAWDEVRHVQGLNAVPSSNFVEVYVYRPAPMSESFRILANPSDRQGFIAALRRLAPQAEFEV